MLQMLAIGAMIGGSLLKGAGAYGEGVMSEGLADINASSLLNQSRDVLNMSRINLYRQGRYADKVKGAQIAAIAKSGGSMSDPTSEAILRETESDAALDEFLIKYNAMHEASSLKTQAYITDKAGDQALKAGKIGLATSLLNGAGNAYFAGGKT